MAGDHGAPNGVVSGFGRYAGPRWRAVAAGREAHALDGGVRPGRYNRLDECTLSMSGSEAGLAAAMARYGEAPRALKRVSVDAHALIDLRDAAACVGFGIDPAQGEADWIASLDRGEEPPSWRVSDRARAIGATGLNDGSRRAPAAWHLVLLRWNAAGGARVVVAAPTRE